MCPYADYVIGYERNAGVDGFAPILLWDFLPMEIVLVLPILLWSFPFLPIIEFSTIGVFLVIMIIILVGFSTIIVFQGLLRVRFRNPYHNTELEFIMNRAKDRLGYSCNPEIWLYSSFNPVLVPLSALSFKAIVLSESAANDLVASPENGEIVIADVLVSLEGRPYLSTWAPLVTFFLLSSFIFPWTGFNNQVIGNVLRLWFLVLLLVLGYFVTRPNESRESPIEQEYGIHSDIARCAVFRNRPPSETELKQILKRSQKPFPGPASRVWRGISFIVATTLSILAWPTTEYFVNRILLNTSPLFPSIYARVPFVVALLTLVGVSIGLNAVLARGELNQIEDV